jgi:hypothetical protein
MYFCNVQVLTALKKCVIPYFRPRLFLFHNDAAANLIKSYKPAANLTGIEEQSNVSPLCGLWKRRNREAKILCEIRKAL